MHEDDESFKTIPSDCEEAGKVKKMSDKLFYIRRKKKKQ